MIDREWKLIDDLAAELGVDPNVRRVWRQRHVPHKWRLPILLRAEKQGLRLNIKAFDKKRAKGRVTP